MDSLERETRERKKKMIALASLPLCLGFFLWRIQTTTVAAPPPKAPPAPVVAQAAPAVAAAVGPVMSLEKQRIVEVPLGDRDPFVQTVKLAETGAPSASPAGTTSKPVLVTELPNMTPLPTVNPMLHSFGTPTPVTAPSPLVTKPGTLVAAAPVAPPMPYVLSGVVQGNPDVAVLKHFDGSRRIARVGDILDPKFRLVAIQETTVVLEGGGEKKTLRLDGETPAATPAKK
ncbi:MAG TPA: hypothetical protein VGM51_00355 [Armatimonadota bacterium]|jgi:hypothetical protein